MNGPPDGQGEPGARNFGPGRNYSGTVVVARTTTAALWTFAPRPVGGGR